MTATATTTTTTSTAPGNVTELDHVNFGVRDLDRSLDWYRRAFGFVPRERGVRMGVRWAIVQVGGALLALYEHADRHLADDDELARHRLLSVAHFGLRIRDRAAWEETVRREGVYVDHTAEYPHSFSWYVRDPDGYEIEVALWHDGVRFPA